MENVSNALFKTVLVKSDAEISEINNKYKIFNISQKKLGELRHQALEMFVSSGEDSLNCFISQYNDLVKEYVSSVLDDKRIIKYGDEILKNATVSNSYLELSNFFKLFDFVPSIETCLSLIKKNSKLQSYLNQKYGNREVITFDDILKLEQNGLSSEILQAYAVFKSIPFVTELEVETNNDEVWDEEDLVESDFSFFKDGALCLDDEYCEEELSQLENDKDLDIIKQYIEDISKYPLLSEEEEKELGRRILQNDQQALKKLIESNLRIVLKVANKFKNANLPFLDLVQEGNIGLQKAAEKFDYRKGFKFSTFAYRGIYNHIQRALEEKDRIIRHPNYMSQRYYQSIRHFRKNLGRTPTIKELAKDMKVPETRLMEFLQDTHMLSLNVYVCPEKEKSQELGYFIPDDSASVEDSFFESRFVEDMKKAIDMANLTSQERHVIKLRMGINLDRVYMLEEVAAMYKVSRERIRQIELKALKKLRTPKITRLLIDYTSNPSVAERNLRDIRELGKVKGLELLTVPEVENFYSYFSEYSNDQAYAAFSRLSLEEKFFVRKIFNGDLFSAKRQITEDENIKFNKLISKMKNDIELNNIRIKMSDDTEVSLINLFCNKAMTQINLNELPLDVANTIKQYCYPNLTLKKDVVYEPEFLVVLNKLRKMVATSRFELEKSLNSYFEEYSMDIIKKALAKLSSDEETVVASIYDLSSFEVKDNKISCYDYVIFIDIIEKLAKILSEHYTKSKIRNIYSFFPNYDEKFVDNVVLNLNFEEYRILVLKFGPDFKNPLDVKLSQTEENSFFELISKMEFTLQQMFKIKVPVKSIYDILSDYSREDVDNAISKLSPEQRSVLTQKFGPDLDNPLNGILSKENQMNLKKIISKIKRIIKRKDNPYRADAKHTIYEYFPKNTKEEINNALLAMPYEYSLVLEKRYGMDLENPIDEALIDEELRVFKNVTAQLRYKLKMLSTPEGKVASKYLYYYTSYLKKKSRLEIISSLTVEEQNFLKVFFGQNYDELQSKEFNANEKQTFRLIISKIHKMAFEVAPHSKKNIYDYFIKYPRTIVDEALKELLPAELNILKRKFGENLDTIINKEFDKGIHKAYYSIMLKLESKIKKMYEGTTQTLYSYFEDYSTEEIDYVLYELSDYDLELLKRKYGDDFKTPPISCKLDKRDKERLTSVRNRMRKGLQKNRNEGFSLVISSASEFPTLQDARFYDVVEKMHNTHGKIVVARFGLNGKVNSLEEVSEMFDVSTEDVIQICKYAIQRFYQEIGLITLKNQGPKLKKYKAS